jgi:hypothetical protein
VLSSFRVSSKFPVTILLPVSSRAFKVISGARAARASLPSIATSTSRDNRQRAQRLEIHYEVSPYSALLSCRKSWTARKSSERREETNALFAAV